MVKLQIFCSNLRNKPGPKSGEAHFKVHLVPSLARLSLFFIFLDLVVFFLSS